MSTNDVNPYAVLISRCQGAISIRDIDDLVARVQAGTARNYDALLALAPASFASRGY